MFEFVVRHCRWLARVPLMPHLFDAFLLGWTCVTRPGRLAAMQELEAQAVRRWQMSLSVHRLGGVGFVCGNAEAGHVHSNGLVHAYLGAAQAKIVLANREAQPHCVFKAPSGWVGLQLETTADVPGALVLLDLAVKRLGQVPRVENS